MSNMGSIGSGANDLLWALKHQFQAARHAAGGHAQGGNAGGIGLSSALVGGSGAAGLTGSALLASTDASSATSGTTGAAGASPGVGPVRLGPGMLAALLQIQEQAAATDPTATTQTGTDPDQGRGASFAQKLFGAIDTSGDGQISKGELESAFASIGRDPTQADNLFARLDANGDGSVSQNELNRALRHGHHHGGAMDALTSLGQMQSSDTVTNADGSTTTTVTYANGAKVAITIPASAAQNGATGAPTDSAAATASTTPANAAG